MHKALVVCPTCESQWTHHADIEVYKRDGEDGLSKVTVIGERAGTLSNQLNENPSRRRDGIRIWFWCEWCHAEFNITIAQHKGQTLVDGLKLVERD